MRTLALIALLCLATVATATPLDYLSVLYSTSAFAEVGGVSDGINSDSSPPSVLPLFSSANVTGGDEFAAGDGIADDFFLAASSEASSSSNPVGAVGEAAFEAEFTGDGRYRLVLNFDSFSDVLGGSAGAELAIALSVGATTVFDESFILAGGIERLFDLGVGELGVLSINLISTADALGAYAFNLASVDVDVAAVPLPGTLALVCPGLVLAWRQRRRPAPATVCD